ncbi:hypothetical protein Anas_06357 [Armadillidium nasatum]|uniref:NTR domain-containing protein n=1 Tax=Armadillidium nasatum TaxID=96803 RepID=A0A5N5SJT1_9CRUS|nr:hypothetical protein Anas_06357 [Armadillidium nasatum]
MVYCYKTLDRKGQACLLLILNVDESCSACEPVDTYENILDNFCRSEIVFRAQVKTIKGRRVSLRKLKIFKSDITKNRRRNLRLLLDKESECCQLLAGKERYLIMGVKAKKNFVTPTFILSWKKSKSMRNALKMFRNLNCSDPNLFTPTADDGTIVPQLEGSENVSRNRKEKKNRKKKKNNRKKNMKDRKMKEDNKNN